MSLGQPETAVAAPVTITWVNVPTVTSISPTAGPLAGGTTVTVTGTNLTGATAVDFGSTPATNFTPGLGHLSHRHRPGGVRDG